MGIRAHTHDSPQELELLELQREHGQLASRFAETQDNYEEALEARCSGRARIHTADHLGPLR